MKIEMGESLIYSWLRRIKKCQIVQTNWKISTNWGLKNKNEIETLKNKTENLFKNKEEYIYEIYKKNSSCDQMIEQGECDAIGMSMENNKIYAVDIAFHESGLNYGSREKTVAKILEKSLRTAMCLYGYMDFKDAEIIFASPKINESVLDDINPLWDKMQSEMNKMNNLNCNFKFSLIANKGFKKDILTPVLNISDKVTDTNELFLRSYQMLNLFPAEKEPKPC